LLVELLGEAACQATVPTTLPNTTVACTHQRNQTQRSIQEPLHSSCLGRLCIRPCPTHQSQRDVSPNSQLHARTCAPKQLHH